MKIMTRATALLCVFLLTACGWHLRGSLNLPSDLHSIYIQGASANLHQALSQQLQASNITVTQSASNAQYTLAIANERQDRRTAALGSDALAAQYEFISSADFEFRTPSGDLLGMPDKVQITRSVNFDASQVLGSASESELVKREMTRDLASQIIRRLSFLANAPSATATSTQGHHGTPAP